MHAPVRIDFGDANLMIGKLLREGIMQRRDPSYMAAYPSSMVTYRQVYNYIMGIDKSAAMKQVYDINMLLTFPIYKIQTDYKEKNTVLLNKYVGAPTQAMSEKGSAMQDAVTRAMISVIIDRKSVV